MYAVFGGDVEFVALFHVEEVILDIGVRHEGIDTFAGQGVDVASHSFLCVGIGVAGLPDMGVGLIEQSLLASQFVAMETV